MCAKQSEVVGVLLDDINRNFVFKMIPSVNQSLNYLQILPNILASIKTFPNKLRGSFCTQLRSKCFSSSKIWAKSLLRVARRIIVNFLTLAVSLPMMVIGIIQLHFICEVCLRQCCSERDTMISLVFVSAGHKNTKSLRTINIKEDGKVVTNKQVYSNSLPSVINLTNMILLLCQELIHTIR